MSTREKQMSDHKQCEPYCDEWRDEVRRLKKNNIIIMLEKACRERDDAKAVLLETHYYMVNGSSRFPQKVVTEYLQKVGLVCADGLMHTVQTKKP